MKKWILRIGIGIVALLIVVVLVIGLFADHIIKAGIEKGGSYALDVDTQVETVDLSLLSGNLTIDGLQVANPEGFKREYLMKSGTFDVGVRPGSLLSDTIEVSHFELDGLELNIEQKLSGSNVSEILDNLKRFESDEEPEPAEEEPSEGKKVAVSTIVIKDVTARFYLLPELSPVPITVRIPEMELENVTSEDEGGIMVARLVSRLVPAILAGVIEQAGDAVPTGFLNDLDGQVGDAAKALGGQAAKLVGQLSAGESTKAVEEGVKGIGKKLTGLLGGKKDSPPQEEEEEEK